MTDWKISYETLKKLQVGSGLVFGSFLGLHLTSVVGALYGPFFYDESLNFFRKYYQNPVVELVVVGGSLAVHLGSSYGLISYKQLTKTLPATGAAVYSKKPTKQDLAEKLHTWSGWILTTGIGAHFIGTRLSSLIYGSDYLADFSLISWTQKSYTVFSWSLEEHPFIFYPFYFLWASAGFYHSLYGALKAMAVFKIIKSDTLISFRRSWPFFLIAKSGVLLMLSSVIAFTRGFLHDVTTEKYPLWKKIHTLAHYLPSLSASQSQ